MSLLELLLVQVQTVQMIYDQQFSNAENMDENLLMVGRRRLPTSECLSYIRKLYMVRGM